MKFVKFLEVVTLVAYAIALFASILYLLTDNILYAIYLMLWAILLVYSRSISYSDI